MIRLTDGGSALPRVGKAANGLRAATVAASRTAARAPRAFFAGLVLTFALAAGLSAPLIAQPANDPAPLSFSDDAEEHRFHALVAELRCVMCQNQSLADSNAQIAHDLRREVLALMRQGKSDAAIKSFLVARYGEFVLYRPQVESKTWLLWFGPALLLVVGGFVVARVVRARGAPSAAGDRTRNEEEQEW